MYNLILTVLLSLNMSIFFVACSSNIQVEQQTLESKNEYQKSILRVDTKSHSAPVRKIITSSHGDIITASDDMTIRVWDSITLQEKRKILGEINPSEFGEIYSIALSNNERLLAVAGVLGNKNKRVSHIRIYDYKSGELIKILNGHKDSIHDLSFNYNDQYLVSSSSSSIIWDVKNNFKLKDTINFHKRKIYSNKFFVNNNKEYCVFVSLDNLISIYDMENKKIINSYDTKFTSMSLAINQDHIAVSGIKQEIFIFNKNLILLQKIKRKNSSPSLHFTKNGKYLISGSDGTNPTVDVYQFINNKYKKISSFNKHNNSVIAVNSLNDKIAITVGGDSQEIYLWSLKSGKLLNKIVGAGKSKFSVLLSKNAISWGNTRELKEINRLGKLKNSINLTNFNIYEYNQSNEHKTIPIQNGRYSLEKHTINNQTIEYLAIKKDDIIIKKIFKDFTNGRRHNCYGWYNDYIISGGDNGHIIIYDEVGNEVASLKGHDSDVWAISIYKNKLVSASTDQTIILWDLSKLHNIKEPVIDYSKIKEQINTIKEKTGKEFSINRMKQIIDNQGKSFLYKELPNIYPTLNIFSLDNLNKGEYIAWTKEGFFDASKGAGEYIGYHINQGPYKEAEFVTVENMYSTFYRPDLIQKALKGENLEKYAKNINIDKLLKSGFAPEVKILTQSQKIYQSNIKVQAQVCSKGNGGYDNLSFMINETPISITGTTRALKIKKKSKRKDCFNIEKTISLANGKNTIGFKATNKAGNIESKIASIDINFDASKLKKQITTKLTGIADTQEVNNLHILAVAINDYADKDLKLNLAVNDGQGMLKTIKAVSEPLFKNIYVYKLFDKEATKENILNKFKNIKSTRNDVFLLYIAGHGITDEHNGNYYYLPVGFRNDGRKDSLKSQGLGEKDLMLSLSKVSALKSLVLLDTCQSGGFIDSNMQKTTTNKLSRATGRAILSASSSSENAQEGYKGHGVFTYTLMEALKGKGYYGDEKITVNELADYTEEALPKKAWEKWKHKQTPQRSMYGSNFNLGEF